MSTQGSPELDEDKQSPIICEVWFPRLQIVMIIGLSLFNLNFPKRHFTWRLMFVPRSSSSAERSVLKIRLEIISLIFLWCLQREERLCLPSSVLWWCREPWNSWDGSVLFVTPSHSLSLASLLTCDSAMRQVVYPSRPHPVLQLFLDLWSQEQGEIPITASLVLSEADSSFTFCSLVFSGL